MIEPEGAERQAIERDRDLAWELFRVQPEHPRIPELAMSVLARAPQFTGMIILTALHRQACGEVDAARGLLQSLMARRDRQFIGATRELRDLEYSDGNYDESLRLAEIVLREHPEAHWGDRMDYASALIHTGHREQGWDLIDDAVEMCARTEPENFAEALGQRAARFLATGVPADRFLPAAQQAIDADPAEPVLSLALAFAYLYDYRAEESRDLFLRLLREDPTNSPAQGGLMIARGFLDPIERGEGTMDDLRAAGMGEMAWRVLRDTMFDTGLPEALMALDAVLPDDLASALRPPLDVEAARASGGDAVLLAWRDGQNPGSGALWGTGQAFRLMSAEEIGEMDQAIQRSPADWPQWSDERGYYTQIFTDDAGTYVIEGYAGRLYARGSVGQDREVAPSLADWVWDRVASFGGRDPRPGAA